MACTFNETSPIVHRFFIFINEQIDEGGSGNIAPREDGMALDAKHFQCLGGRLEHIVVIVLLHHCMDLFQQQI